MTSRIAQLTVTFVLLSGCTHVDKANQDAAAVGLMESAIERGDNQVVRKLLDNGYDPNLAPRWEHAGHVHDSDLPLSLAVRPPKLDIVELLLLRGADVNARNSDGSTALFSAIQPGESGLQMVKFLLDRGADLNAKANDGTTPVNEARKSLLPELEALLLNRGAKDPFVEAAIWIPQLHVESNGQRRLSRGMSFGNEVQNTLARAAGDGEIEAIKNALETAADLNTGDPHAWGCSALAIAAIRNKRDAVEYLLSRGADPNVRNKTGETALMLAAATITSDVEILRLLISHGADVRGKDGTGNTAVDYALISGNTNAVIFLEMASTNQLRAPRSTVPK